jgi:hypothetical protein
VDKREPAGENPPAGAIIDYYDTIFALVLIPATKTPPMLTKISS